jgi:hypothetical protein
MGNRPRTRTRKATERKRLYATAVHEAGHAVACILLDLPVKRVSIQPDEDFLGHVVHALVWRTRLTRPREADYEDPREYRKVKGRYDLAMIDADPTLACLHERGTLRRLYRDTAVALAGEIAERRFTGRSNRVGALSDWRNATDIALPLCGSQETTSAFLRWVELDVQALFRRGYAWAMITGLARALVTLPAGRRRMTGKAARAAAQAAADAALQRESRRSPPPVIEFVDNSRD